MVGNFLVRFKEARELEYNQRVLASCKSLEKELQNSQYNNFNFSNRGILQSNASYLNGKVSNSKTEKYQFEAQENTRLEYNTEDPVKLCLYDNQDRLVEDKVINDSERYSVFIISQEETESNYSVNLNLNTELAQSSTASNNDLIINNDSVSLINNSNYNVKNYPDLENSQQLERIVDQILAICQNNDLPTQDVSITLIDLNRNTIAQHQGNTPRYPASVAKLFWLVTFYSSITENNNIQLTSNKYELIEEMVSQSDNEATSKIIDFITQTQSGSIESADFNFWHDQRQQLNRFFKKANYSETLNISQKTYPIPYLEEYGNRPKGLELEMRHLGNYDENNPIRNQLTTYDSARLMYEIVNNQAISPKYSQKMQNHLERDLNPRAWRDIDPNLEFNPVLAFFGQKLPQEIKFLSKAGWTSNTRHEVAYIETPSQETRYIIAIFTEDEAYAQNWEIFPQLSRFVFEQLNQ